MPNNAWTEYKVYDTKENIQLLVDAIEQEKQVHPSQPNMWDIAKNLGLDDIDKYSIRGTLIDTELSEDGTSLLMVFDCAWDWQEDFIKALNIKFPNMAVYFYCTECGFDVFVTNSFAEFPTRYIVEDTIDMCECFESLETLIDFLQNHQSMAQYREKLDFSNVSSEEEINELFDNWNENNEDTTLYLRIFEEI